MQEIKSSMKQQPSQSITSLQKKIEYTILLGLFVLVFFPVIQQLIEAWNASDDNSHGFFIVPVSLFLIYQKKNEIKNLEIVSGAYDRLLLSASVLLFIFANMAHIATLKDFSLVTTIWAIVWSLFGKNVFKTLLFPLFLLLFLVPVPAQVFSMATIPLQLIVSKASTLIASLFNVPILRDGNVLHLPDRTLAVVQACSGLRSLVSLAYLCAVFSYLTLKSNPLRTVLFFSSIPVAIFVNVIRVVSIVLSIYFFDFDLAAGSMHTIFGLLIFIVALAVVASIRGILSRWDSKSPIG